MLDQIAGKNNPTSTTTESSVRLLTSSLPVTHAQRQKGNTVELTRAQAAVLIFVRDWLKKNGFHVSRTDLREGLSIASQSGADGFLQRLARRGWLKVAPRIERGICLLREGAPIYEPEDFRTTTVQVTDRDETAREPDWIDCDALWELCGGMPDLCLRIRGDAMERAGLTDGGIVAIRLVSDARVGDGDVVAARSRDDVVLRRFHRVNDTTAELHPETANPEHEVLRSGAESTTKIIGVVVGRMLAGAG